MPYFLLRFVQPNFETCGYDGDEQFVIIADDMEDAWAKGKLMEREIIEKNKWTSTSAGLAGVRGELSRAQVYGLKRSRGIPLVS